MYVPLHFAAYGKAQFAVSYRALLFVNVAQVVTLNPVSLRSSNIGHLTLTYVSVGRSCLVFGGLAGMICSMT